MQASTASQSSYGRVLKTSSISGGARGLSALIGAVRTKFVALLLGPEGVGLLSLYQSAYEMAGKTAELGLGGSGTRSLADAYANGGEQEFAAQAQALRRTLLLFGIAGLLMIAAAAPWLNQWVFNGEQSSALIALLGFALVFRNWLVSQEATLRGMRRIGTLAKLQVFNGLSTTLIFIGIFATLGVRGIAWAILASSALSALTASILNRGALHHRWQLSFGEAFDRGRRLIGLGSAFLWAGMIGALAALLTRLIIVDAEGIEANGIYQAAWGVSGMLATFIFSAMGADFYPSLSAVAGDNHRIGRLVHEQTEVALLLALPGLLLTIALAPWLIRLFYTADFASASSLIPLFAIAVFGKTLSWPAGFIQLAKGSSKTFAFTETAYYVLQLSLAWVGIRHLGLAGAALAVAIANLAYVGITLAVARRVANYSWSRPVARLAVASGALVALATLLPFFAPPLAAAIGGLALTLAVGIAALRQLLKRLGPNHRIIRALARAGLRLGPKR